MAITGQMVFRFCGALLLAGAATTMDHPRAPTAVLPQRPAVAQEGRVAPTAMLQGGELRITPGKRAFGIRIDDVSGQTGLIQPNSRVDIMVVIADPNDGGRRIAKMFMSDMRLLAIGMVVQRDREGNPAIARVATIEVTPEEAKRLAVATTQGQIQLVPRASSAPTAPGRVAPLRPTWSR